MCGGGGARTRKKAPFEGGSGTHKLTIQFVDDRERKLISRALIDVVIVVVVVAVVVAVIIGFIVVVVVIVVVVDTIIFTSVAPERAFAVLEEVHRENVDVHFGGLRLRSLQYVLHPDVDTAFWPDAHAFYIFERNTSVVDESPSELCHGREAGIQKRVDVGFPDVPVVETSRVSGGGQGSGRGRRDRAGGDSGWGRHTSRGDHSGRG